MGLFSSQLSTKTMVPVCRQLSTSYNAGIPIIRSLDLVAEQSGNRGARRVLRAMSDEIRNGESLARTARRHSKELPGFFVELLAAGEAGGRLDTMLGDLSEYYEDRLKMQRMIVAAALYPLLQLAAAWFLGTFALRAVTRVGKGLDIRKYFLEYVLFQIEAMAVLAVIGVICLVLYRMGIFQWILGWVTTYLWPLASVTRRFAMARFYRSMALLIGSGLPMVECIERSADVAGNPYIARDLRKAVPYVKQGCSLTEAFGASRYVTSTAREMLLVGEQSGKLDTSLRKAADYYVAEASQAVSIATVIGGVMVVIAVAALIGYIVISFYSKLYGGMLNDLGI